MKEYLVVIHRAAEGGYWAEVPTLDGYFAQGETVEEVLADARGAITSHLVALEEDGLAPPEESGILIATVTLTAA